MFVLLLLVVSGKVAVMGNTVTQNIFSNQWTKDASNVRCFVERLFIKVTFHVNH